MGTWPAALTSRQNLLIPDRESAPPNQSLNEVVLWQVTRCTSTSGNPAISSSVN